MAAGHSVEIARFAAAEDELLGRVSGRFGRVETRRRFAGLLRGMFADLPRKNCWTISLPSATEPARCDRRRDHEGH